MKKISFVSLILVFCLLSSLVIFNVSAANKIDFEPVIERGRIYGIEAGSTKGDVDAVYHGHDIQIKDTDKNVVEDDNAAVGTGYALSLDGVFYSVVVMGDVDGDGEITADDYIDVKRAVLGTGSLGTLGKEAVGVQNGEELRAIHYMMVKRAYFGSYDINHKYSCDPYVPDTGDNEIIVSGWW